MNNLFGNLSSNPKQFTDDTSFVHDINQSRINLNKDLKEVRNLAFQRKMCFNSDINEQAQDVISSQKLQKLNRPSSTFNSVSVSQSEIRKHLEECFWTQNRILRNLQKTCLIR